MKAVWQLWLQLWKRMPVLAVLSMLMCLTGLVLALIAMLDARVAYLGMGFVAFASWFWHIGLGQVLRGVCRPESFLLPGFRSRLAWLGVAGVVQWVLLPGALLVLAGPPHGALIIAGLFVVASLGLALGCGRRVSLAIWAVFIAAGWMPRLAAQVTTVALASPWTAPLLFLCAALLIRYALAPLLRIQDVETPTSPLENASIGRNSQSALDDTPARRGAWNRWLGELFDRAAQRALERSLQTYRQRPSAAGRLALVRRLLLPHDNPQAIALRLVLVAGMVAIYFLAVMHRQHFDAAVIGAYAVLLTMARFPQLGRGMLRMRPNLADLYLTLAPATRGEYQKIMVDALILLVPVSVLTALAYTLLGSVLAHAAEPVRMLLTAAIVATSASLVALAVHLIGPEGSFGRGAINLVLIFGAMATYWGGYWLLGALGLAWGALALGAVTISFGGGVWYAAQREYQRRAPRFDAPLG
ncbi:hypothetical protein KK141_14650 [Dyella sp. LX-66]|uniref:hypothetical protein n=1 Tax=unclassified Dyella TaxID=2634549 RepID=UPI001BE0961D|nr:MULTISPECIES: hypothetical protein [unclassified Dyella]MBT2116273.1 hypothetical protein [Dyella sp. LX-1]MBT2140784.1 hypothetical protein [Dyella sp. LX-66]